MNRRTWWTGGPGAWATVAALALGVGACSRHSALPAGTPEQPVGEWRVAVANVPTQPRVGENVLRVRVRDAAARPMRGSVDVVVRMPAMGAMAAMESRGQVAPVGDGQWRASYGLAMNGEWDLTLKIRPESGREAEARYRISTTLGGVTYVDGTSPTAVTGAAVPSARDTASGSVIIDDARRQQLGIRTAAVQVRPLGATVRVAGRVAYDESRQAEVTLKFSGFVRDLDARVTGQPVRKGEVLFTTYSPELWAAQQEALEARRAAADDRAHPELGVSSAELARAAYQRLELWDLAPSDIDAMLRTGRPRAAFPVRSPTSGIVSGKNVVTGSAFSAGQVLFRIAPLDPVWIVASVPQSQLALVRLAGLATLRDPYSGARPRTGRVAFISPALDSTTRSVEVRVTVPNPTGALKPGTFVDVELTAPPEARLAIPRSAVLSMGARQIVFVDLGEGRLSPRDVRLGLESGPYVEVLGGLRAGDRIVTSGNFLVGADAQLRSAAGGS